MLTPDAPFYVAWAALVIEVLCAINLARLAKKGTILTAVSALLPTSLFLIFHSSWWMSNFHRPESVVAYVVGCVASLAFLFGSAFLTTGCLTIKDEELCIDTCNPVFKLVKKLPINFEGRSLCTISWLAALALLVMPIVMVLFYVVCAIISLLVCLWTWKNPVPYFLILVDCHHWPETTVLKSSKGIWISPTPYVVAVALLTMFIKWLVWMAHFGLFWVVLFWIALSVVSLVASWFGLWLLTKKYGEQWSSMSNEEAQTMDYEVRQAYRSLNPENKAEAFKIFGLFWQIFRQKYCPKIKYCNADGSDCDD